MADLRALAELAESGSGTDRELNASIAFALKWRPQNPESKRSFAEHEAKHDYATAWIAHAPWRGSWDIPNYSGSIDAARSLFPWTPHPCATLGIRLIQSGVSQFLCQVEFTWPSTEIQGRARDEARATLACALRANQRTHEELAESGEEEGMNDQYIVLCAQVVGGDADPFRTEYHFDGKRFDGRSAAIDHGFKIRGSDDFNIGVLRAGELVSLDWMSDPVDAEPARMSEIAKQVAL